MTYGPHFNGRLRADMLLAVIIAPSMKDHPEFDTRITSLYERPVSFKEWRPAEGHAEAGVEKLPHGFLWPLDANNSQHTFARIGEELRKGRIVSTFADKTLLVLGPHHDSPDVPIFDEDMKHYHRRIA
jgi:hypothetical protein